ncbi:MAG TPA: RNA polymerase factor sigma-32 [Kofleriaceae bacterium]|jgi:RNA polymerase sigma-32 factor|nr:RNA polymerase factor sigma-32 [Kofleriaceae bacterium]
MSPRKPTSGKPSTRKRAKRPSTDEAEGGGADGEKAEGEAGGDEEEGDGEGEARDDDEEALVAEVVDAPDEEPEQVEAELDKIVGGGSREGLVRHDPLTAYIQETRRFPLLSREEEHELAVRLSATGDTAAARRLIESNLRLVVKIAYEYRRAHRNLLDLVQEGNVGLMQAVRKYDPYRGVKLSTYAAWWIRAYILKFILNNWRLVKIGTTQAQRKLFFNLRKEKERLEQLGFQPDTRMLAERLDVREKDVVEMEKRLAAPDASLDAPVGRDEGEGTRTRMDTMEDPGSERPDVSVERSEFNRILREKLEAFAETVKGREQTIFRERWLADEPMTLQEIGDRYGISRERARQLEKRLLGRLRKYLEKELGAAVDIDALSRE